MFKNQDRAIREKCNQLEIQNIKLSRLGGEQEYEMLRLQKIEKDLLINRDVLLAQIHDMSARLDD